MSMHNNDKIQLFEDVYNSVYDDKYMWIVVWGPPRTSKTTVAGWILYSLYKDWHKVLRAFVFTLPQLMMNIKMGLPERWPTKNGLHNRVPVINWDDFGAYSNKAVTQYDEGWDNFKGGFDVLGTKIGVLVATMVDPLEATYQIQNKYTHEIQVQTRGVYKYDEVRWEQDFHGWKPRTRKRHIETNTYDPWPDWAYKEYDLMRVALADEVMQRIEDATTISRLDIVFKLCKEPDFQLLHFINTRGPIHHHLVKDKEIDHFTITRLKARGLIVPTEVNKDYYKYDLSSLGRELVNKWEKAEPVKAKLNPLLEQTSKKKMTL